MKKKAHLVGKNLVMIFMAGLISCLAVSYRSSEARTYATEPAESVTLAHTGAFLKHHSESLPLTPFPTPLESNIPDEVESKDECDDEINKVLATLSLKACELLHSEKYLFLNLRGSIQNRSSVSLFILYHCWRAAPVDFDMLTA